MKKLGRSFAAALLLFAMTAVTLADGQMDFPLTSPTPTQSNSTYTEPTDAPTSTTSNTDSAHQIDTTLTEAGLVLFQSLSSVL
ncbi:MAG: hypothetical protein M3348_17690 [Acidobacteriota bacterium]|nr:hypothetical protein [Acidobacteriota bacterium]